MDKLARNVLAPLVLRLGLAVVFIFHGMGKLGSDNKWGTGWDKRPEEQRLSPALQAPVAWGEFLGGVAVGIGFLSRIAALGLIAIMAGAIATVQGQHDFGLHSGPTPGGPPLGYEYNFVLIVLCIGVVLLGTGPLGLDYWIRPRRAHERQ